MNQNMTMQEFKEYLRDTRAEVTIIKLGAEWCGPCRGASKYMSQILPYYTDKPLKYVEIDIDTNKDMYMFFKRSLGIKGIPTIMIYRKKDYDESTFYAPFRVTTGFDNKVIDKIIKEALI
jgi:thiol-disulfide isomerase/thioredoxin